MQPRPRSTSTGAPYPRDELCYRFAASLAGHENVGTDRLLWSSAWASKSAVRKITVKGYRDDEQPDEGGCNFVRMGAISQQCRIIDVRDATVGSLGTVNACCFEVRREGGLQSLFIQYAAVIGKDERELALVCDASELSRYTCGQHGKRSA